MRYGNGLPVAFHIDVTTQGQLPGIDDYVSEHLCVSPGTNGPGDESLHCAD